MVHKPSTPVEIAVIPDRIERLRACVRVLADQRHDTRAVMEIRDKTIRWLCDDGMSRSQVALQTGVSLNVVIDALRKDAR